MVSWGGAAITLEQRLLARFRNAGISSDSPLVVAFSGGPDSLALAAALTHVRAVTGLPVVLVHVDHRLRESSAEAALAAAELAGQIGIDLVVRRVPTSPLDAHPHCGVEEAARRERYRILKEEALRLSSRTIATGHHRDDQAETVLLHLLRGSGLRGATGMRELSSLPAEYLATKPHDISQRDDPRDLRLWRPFLGEPRATILAYLGRRGLLPLTDPSNDDITLRRNAIRHRVLPEMERAVPGAAAALARFASLAAEEDLLLERMVDQALASVVGQNQRLNLVALKAEPQPMQRRILRRWLVDATGESTVSAERVESVLRWATHATGAGHIELPGNWCVRRSGEWLIVGRNTRSGDDEGTSK